MATRRNFLVVEKWASRYICFILSIDIYICIFQWKIGHFKLIISYFGWIIEQGLYLCSLYWKIKYVSRLQYLWSDIKKGEIEIPEFVQNHDNVLEHRPLTDYGIEPDHLHLPEVPNMAYSFGRHDGNWGSREFMR